MESFEGRWRVNPMQPGELCRIAFGGLRPLWRKAPSCSRYLACGSPFFGLIIGDVVSDGMIRTACFRWLRVFQR